MAFAVREVDPDGPDVEHFADVIRRSNAEEFGDLAQQRSADELRARIKAATPRLRCFVSWLDDLPVGTLDMQVLADQEPDVVEVHIRILKDFQGHTLGRSTLAHAERVALVMGRTRVTGISACRRAPDRNARFMRHSGFSEVENILRQDVRLPSEQAAAVLADLPAGYVVETYRRIDEPMLLAFAHLLNRRCEDLLDFCMPMSVDEVRSMYEAGMGLVVSVAREEGSDNLVGYSELLTHAGTPISDQGATFVVPEHDGRGLAKALKAANIVHISSPGGPRALRQFVQQADAGTPELNRELGFTDTAQYIKWEKSLA